MKRLSTILLVCVAGMMLTSCRGVGDASNGEFVHTKAGNPYLPLWEHLPDGEPRVFEDPDNPGKYRIYIIGSHDVRYGSYCGPDIRQWSAPVEDLTAWRDEGSIFTYNIDNKWDVMFAPDLVEVRRKDGTKEYYLYPHSRGWRREPMVAKGARPDGPFTPINLTEDGRGVVEGSMFGFDPAVYVDYITDPNDPDYEVGFRAYGYWGFQRSLAAEVDPNTMYSVKEGRSVIDRFIPASFRYGQIRDPKGTEYPHVHPDEDLNRFNFFEASSIRKIGNKYVLIYSGYSGPDYGLSSTNSSLRYAYGDSALGPWKSGGVLVDSRGPVLNQDGSALQTTYAGHNTHGSIEKINDQWYVFYHRAPRGFGFARQPMVSPVVIECDEASVADGGKVVIRGYDPYASDNIWGAKAQNGDNYTGAEVTSEGFHIYGLDPYTYYSAGYACYLSDNRLQKDSFDVWDNGMTIGAVKNGNIIGYKYFGFGGLAQDSKGLKAFEGTKEGNNTHFNLYLQPKSDKAFTIEVWLDGPWANATWQGKKIGQISVPAGAEKSVTEYSVNVSEAVDKLDKKHALYIVAVGPDGEELCDIVGLGFSAKGKKIERPEVPEVTIKVGGEVVELPKIPIRSTDENGITGYNDYEVVCKLAQDGILPKISASASNRKVKISITQPETADKEAVVECWYNNQPKRYHIRFE